MFLRAILIWFVATAAWATCVSVTLVAQTRLEATIVDSQTGDPLAARVYLRMDARDSTWLHVQAQEGGDAVPYSVNRGASVEIHTSVSPHGFVAELMPGAYDIVIERGKEYLPLRETIEIGSNLETIVFKLRRWTNQAEEGWFSGETHVHRPVDQLATVMMAEDLNVAFPLTYWVTDSSQVPSRDRRDNSPEPDPELVQIDDTHVYWPVNTEYEIFTIEGERHTLGALFVLNHREPIEISAPPIGTVVEAARQDERVIFDLDKHNWPWSMMLIPVTGVELFELTNNHVWRTNFLFKDWYADFVPEHIEIERDEAGGFTEQGWIDFGLETYYLLRNCGFDIKPTGGTASGVHPVPIGFGRVYVYLEDGFDFDSWVEGLRKGRSFVTTGPMLNIRFAGKLPGAKWVDRHWSEDGDSDASKMRITGTVTSPDPIERVEVVQNGKATALPFDAVQTDSGAWQANIDADVEVVGSQWLAVRCFARTSEDRVRFAHTGPVDVIDSERPIRPSRDEVQYLIRRMDDEIERHRGVLDASAIDEFEKARAHFRALIPTR